MTKAKTDKPDDDIVDVEAEETALAVTQESGLAVLGTPEDLQAQLATFSEKRRVVIDYIAESFVEGMDFGKAYEGSAKKTLLKPGAEKICRLFNTSPVWSKDEDTWEMLGRPNGVVCYICRIVDNVSGQTLGEGRGAGTVGDKKRDANKTIKIAEKCALVDAALYTFCLSEMFTQDLDDLKEPKDQPPADENAKPGSTRQQRQDGKDTFESVYEAY
jgi:hypothetical protein